MLSFMCYFSIGVYSSFYENENKEPVIIVIIIYKMKHLHWQQSQQQ